MNRKIIFYRICTKVKSELLSEGIQMGICMGDVFENDNLMNAMEYLHRKHDGCGSDGVMLSEIEDYWAINGDKIKNAIADKIYTVGLVKQEEIVNRKGK